MNRLVRTLADFAIGHAGLAWCMVVLVTIPAVLALAGVIGPKQRPNRVHWETEEDDQAYRRIAESFPFTGLPLAIVIGSDDFFTAKRLKVLNELVDELESSDDVLFVIWFGAILDQLGGLPSPIPDDPDALNKMRETAQQQPMIRSQLMSESGKTILIPIIGYHAPQEIRPLREQIQARLEPHGMTAHLTGMWAVHHAYDEAFENEHKSIQLLAYGLVVVLAWITFRSITAMLISISGSFLGMVWAEGYLTLMGQPPNQLTEIIMPVLVVMIGFTDGVHLVVHIRQAHRTGMTRKEAAHSAIVHVGLACGLTSVTTSVSFASLMLAQSDVIRWFGWSCSIAVLFTFVAVTAFIPMLSASILGSRIGAGIQKDLAERQMGYFVRWSEAAVKRSRGVTVAALIVTVALGLWGLRLKPDGRLKNRIPNRDDAYIGLTKVDRDLGGMRFLRCVVHWNDEAKFSQIWKAISDVEQLMAETPDVAAPLSAHTLSSLLPVSPALGGEAVLNAIPAEFRNQFWRSKLKRTLVVARIKDLGLQHYDPILAELQTRLRMYEKTHPNIKLELQGNWIIEATKVRRVSGQLMKSLMLASAVIFVIMTIAFRSLRIGLLAVLPNIFPLVFTAAVRGTLNTSLDIASACSFTVCLGIAVDDTIHFMTRYIHERKEGQNVEESLRRTVRGVGTALVMTTIIMVAGFGSVMTSQLPTHANFAAMGCATLIAALFGDLLILPALIHRFKIG